MEEKRRIILGTSYWPREKGIYWWAEFELGPVRRDFPLLAEYGLELVRLFLRWEDFQPGLNRISVRALDDLVRVADRAHECRLKILPTFFCGHLGGMNWLPAWMVEGGKGEKGVRLFSAGAIRRGRARNMYSDREVRKAQKLLIHETLNALEGHPAVWAWDLGHRPSRLGEPPSRDAAAAWLEEMVNELKRRDSSTPITLGIGREEVEKARVPGPRELAPFVDFFFIHPDPGGTEWAEKAVEEKVPLFLAALAQWLGGKEVLVGDLGESTEPLIPSLSPGDRERLGEKPLADEGRAAEAFRKSLDLLRTNGILGALARSFADYDSSLWDHPPLDDRVEDRFAGLFRADGSPKPAARLIKDYARERTAPSISRDWVDIKPEEYYQDPRGQIARLFRRFRDRL